MDHGDSAPGNDSTSGGDAASDDRSAPDGGQLTGQSTAPPGPGPLSYQAILDHIDTSIFVLDTDGEIVHWNRSLETLTGESQQGAIDLAEEHGVVGPAFYHDGRSPALVSTAATPAPQLTTELPPFSASGALRAPLGAKTSAEIEDFCRAVPRTPRVLVCMEDAVRLPYCERRFVSFERGRKRLGARFARAEGTASLRSADANLLFPGPGA
jgi:PAS domain-containing protein